MSDEEWFYPSWPLLLPLRCSLPSSLPHSLPRSLSPPSRVVGAGSQNQQQKSVCVWTGGSVGLSQSYETEDLRLLRRPVDMDKQKGTDSR